MLAVRRLVILGPLERSCWVAARGSQHSEFRVLTSSWFLRVGGRRGGRARVCTRAQFLKIVVHLVLRIFMVGIGIITGLN